jgi:hypothetical protein
VTLGRSNILTLWIAAALVLLPAVAMAQAPKPEPSCATAGGIAPAVNAAAPADTAAILKAVGGAPSDGQVVFPAAADSTVSHYPPPDSTLIPALKRGGYILVFRHGKTDWAQKDADIVNFADRGAQRNLSEEGRQQSITTGKAIAGLKIPIGKVSCSPMWRCRDTATLMFGHADTTSDLFQKGGKSRDARLRWLSASPAPGKNDVLVMHQDHLIPITKLRRDELKEGDALVVKPLGQGHFEILAHVTPADWIRFLPSRKL